MARIFGQDTSGDRLTTASTPVNAYPFTFFAWYKPVVQAYATNGRTVISICDSASGTFLFGIGGGNTGGVQIIARGTEGTYNVNNTTELLTAGEWNAIAGVYTNSTTRIGYLARLTDTAVNIVNGTGTATIPTSVNRIGVGALVDSSPNQECYGAVAHAAVWNVSLTQEEITSMAIGRLSPLRVLPQSLVFYSPFLGRNSPEIDIIGARNLTVTGSTADNDNPPLNWPTDFN